MSRNVILLFGGESQERLVSVATAQNLSYFVPDAKCWFWAPTGEVIEVSHQELQAHEKPFNVEFSPKTPFIFSDLQQALDSKTASSSVFLLALHGGFGEDGTVQKWMEERNIRFSGSGSTACYNAFDKIQAKKIVAEHGVKVALSLEVRGVTGQAKEQILSMLTAYGKIVVKPVCDGSSVGLCIVDNENAVSRVLDLLASEPQKAFVAEPFVDGVELTVGVFETKTGLLALPCTEIRAEAGRIFDYNGKYLGHGVREITPAEVDDKTRLLAQEVACRAHEALSLKGYSRTDLIISNNEAVFLETNTLPGLTKASLVPQQLAAADIKMSEFVERILELAKKDSE